MFCVRHSANPPRLVMKRPPVPGRGKNARRLKKFASAPDDRPERSAPWRRAPEVRAVSFAFMRRLSVGFRLYADDVRIWARASAVVGAHPVIMECIRGQAGNVPTSRIADIQVLVSGYVITKRTVCSHIQAITSRTANAGPVCGETGCSHIARLQGRWSSGCRGCCGCWRRGCRRGRSRCWRCCCRW